MFISFRLWESGRNSHISQNCCSSLTKSQTWRHFHAKWVATETVWSPLGRPPCHVKTSVLGTIISTAKLIRYFTFLSFIFSSFFCEIWLSHAKQYAHYILTQQECKRHGSLYLQQPPRSTLKHQSLTAAGTRYQKTHVWTLLAFLGVKKELCLNVFGCTSHSVKVCVFFFGFFFYHVWFSFLMKLSVLFLITLFSNVCLSLQASNSCSTNEWKSQTKPKSSSRMSQHVMEWPCSPPKLTDLWLTSSSRTNIISSVVNSSLVKLASIFVQCFIIMNGWKCDNILYLENTKANA